MGRPAPVYPQQRFLIARNAQLTLDRQNGKPAAPSGNVGDNGARSCTLTSLEHWVMLGPLI
jgi:hypothetical protein